MAKKPKFTPAQVKYHIKKIQEAIEKQKRENKSEHFISITPKEIERKLKRVNSPLIFLQGWGPAPPGGTVNYTLGIYNPDATQADSLFAHVWVGSGNVDPTVGTFLLNVDTRFPRLTQPPPWGLALASGASTILHFTLKVPTAAESTNYFGESCLMRGGWFDTGQYLDRAMFVFEVT